METNKYCIFACGGHGTRMGAKLPKQFLRIGEKTILQLSMESIIKAVPAVHIITVLPEEYISYWREECTREGFRAAQTVITGGFTRFHSVRNALERIQDNNALVAVHDGVRPLVSGKLVQSVFEAAALHGAAIPVIPVTDTLKVLRRNEEGSLEDIPQASADRSVMYGAQTPQVFRADILKNAYALPYNTAFTDDASVVKEAGCSIFYVDGERYNIKITTPEDLSAVTALLSANQAG